MAGFLREQTNRKELSEGKNLKNKKRREHGLQRRRDGPGQQPAREERGAAGPRQAAGERKT